MTSKKVKRNRGIQPVAVTAYNLSGKKVKAFKSTHDAARWIIDQKLSESKNVTTISSSITSASLGRENRNPPHARTVAYGFNWKRV